MEGVSPAFASALEAGRERYNALFAQERRESPALDGAEFLELLRRAVGPVVDAVAERAEDRTEPAVVALYDVALEMLSKGLVGSKARWPHFEGLWTQLMTSVAGHLAASPAAVAGPLTNALYHLVTTPRCWAEEWVDSLSERAGDCADAGQLLAVGQVAAWMCGMAQYRSEALKLARSLPDTLVARVIFTGCRDKSPRSLSDALNRLDVDPWHDPAVDGSTDGLQIVGEAGGFRGFGGEFLRPPRVAASDGVLHVTDGDGCWILMADCFGTVFYRVRSEFPKGKSKGRYSLAADGLVKGPNEKEKFPMLAGASSSASTDTTLAVTLPHSHQVFLVGEVTL